MANINHFDFKNYRVFETEIAGRKLTVETGKMAQLANGSCLVRYGDTAVLVTATASAKPRDGIDFFPLSVDFEERLYSVGRIPGSFMRREGRPSEKAILASRQIDRPSWKTTMTTPPRSSLCWARPSRFRFRISRLTMW